MSLPGRLKITRFARITVPCVLFAAVLWSCQPAETYPPPPEGVPDTPYWFIVGDSVQWYMPAETLMLAQMTEGANAEEISKQLFSLRDLGWRMTVTRGPALKRPNDDQSLEQSLFQLERTPEAVSPTSQRAQFADVFWGASTASGKITLHSVISAMRLYDDSSLTYLWPGCVGIVWDDNSTVSEVQSWLDSLGCRTITSPRQIYSYFVHRTWAVELPAGIELFGWLRMFNEDARVKLAVPITTSFDPPQADQRILRRLKGKDTKDPEEFSKLAAAVRQAYYTAHFSESTTHVTAQTRVICKFNLLKLSITTEASTAEEDEALMVKHKGEIISRLRFRIEAWFPYSNIPALVMEPSVTKIQPARK